MSSSHRPLSQREVDAFLAEHPKWHVTDGHLTRVFHFPAFLDGVRFVQQVAQVAEAANHHPDIDVRYSEVTLRLFTHDAGAITEADTRLAKEFGMMVSALRPVTAAVPQKPPAPVKKHVKRPASPVRKGGGAKRRGAR